MNEDTEKFFKKQIRRNSEVTSKEIEEAMPKRAKVSDRNIRILRASIGITLSMGNPREKLTDQHKLVRLRWCKKYLKCNFNYWIWSDKKLFELFKRRRKVWKLPGEPVLLMLTMKYPPKLTL